MGSHLTKNIETNRNSTKTETKTSSDPNVLEKNRRKSSVDSVLTPDYISSTNIKPIGTHIQPKPQSVGHKNESKVAIPSEIVVVSDGPSAADSLQSITFPPTFKPLIPIGYESLSQSYPQLRPEYVIEFGLIIENHLKSRSEFVAKEEQKVIERVKDIDLIVSFISNQFIIERQKRLIKVSENLSKVEEIWSLIEKCENDINNCVLNLEKLNNFLPKSLSIEKFSFNKTG